LSLDLTAARTGPEYIEEPKSGFYLRGADNSGKCYNIKTQIAPLIGAKVAADYTMEDASDLKYFEDPILNFDDSIVYGCHLDLDLA
jgi:hypothetical protein